MHAHSRSFLLVLIAAFGLTLSGCETLKGWGQKIGIGGSKVTLSGGQEVPPVNTQASGTADIKVASDKSVSGTVTTTGVNGVAAHIHQGAAGRNGPVIIPLTKKGDDAWSVPAGAKLTDAQYEAYKAGDLYVNVHSAANKGGEIRAQLKP
jgi:predicted small secreted protein